MDSIKNSRIKDSCICQEKRWIIHTMMKMTEISNNRLRMEQNQEAEDLIDPTGDLDRIIIEAAVVALKEEQEKKDNLVVHQNRD